METPAVPESQEDTDFLRALRQPLVIQTPLQVMMESLFSKVQKQTQALAELQDKLAPILDRDYDTKEVLDRVRVVEGQLHYLTTSKLSPYNQNDVMTRLTAVEQLAQEAFELSSTLRFNHQKDTIPRLSDLEQRLAGVYNLAGRMMTLDDIAQELAVPILELEVAPSPFAGSMSGRVSSGCGDRPPSPSWSGQNPLVRKSLLAGAGTNVGKSNRLSQLDQQIKSTQAENQELRRQLIVLQAQLTSSQTKLQEVQNNSTARFATLEEADVILRDTMREEVTSLREELNRPEVSLAEFSKLQQTVTSVREEVANNTYLVKTMAERDLVRVQEQVVALQSEVQRGRELREVDEVFHDQIQELQEKMRGLESIAGSVRGEVARSMGSCQEGSAGPGSVMALPLMEGSRPGSEKAGGHTSGAVGSSPGGRDDASGGQKTKGAAARAEGRGVLSSSELRRASLEQLVGRPPTGGGEGSAGGGVGLDRISREGWRTTEEEEQVLSSTIRYSNSPPHSPYRGSRGANDGTQHAPKGTSGAPMQSEQVKSPLNGTLRSPTSSTRPPTSLGSPGQRSLSTQAELAFPEINLGLADGKQGQQGARLGSPASRPPGSPVIKPLSSGPRNKVPIFL